MNYLKPFLPRNPVWRDFCICLLVWLVLEIACFAIVGVLTAKPVEIQPQQLFTLSIPLGIGGACLLASSTQITQTWAGPGASRQRRRLVWLIRQVLSWLGLIGIGFPLLILSFQIALKILMPLRA